MDWVENFEKKSNIITRRTPFGKNNYHSEYCFLYIGCWFMKKTYTYRNPFKV